MSVAGRAQPAPRPAWLDRLVRRLGEGGARLTAAPTGSPQPALEGVRQSAVLMLVGAGSAVGEGGEGGEGGAANERGGGADILLTERSQRMRSHAGQVSFPGGAVDPGDAGPVAAALREAGEEVGLDPSGVTVLAELAPVYLPPSRFWVTPVLAWEAVPSPVAPVDPDEVAAVARVPLSRLTDPANRFSVRHPSGYTGPGFAVDRLFVWGFTGGLLAGLLDAAGLARPWDATRVRPLPERRPSPPRQPSVQRPPVEQASRKQSAAEQPPIEQSAAEQPPIEQAR